MGIRIKDVALVVDCRTSNQFEANFYSLNIWGIPCCGYVCEQIKQFKDISKYVLTDSKKINHLLSKYCYNQIHSIDNVKEKIVILISGTAIFLKNETINYLLKRYRGGVLYAEYQDVIQTTKHTYIESVYSDVVSKAIVIFEKNKTKSITKIKIDSKEGIIINSINLFELAIVLKKKENNVSILKNAVLSRIKEKEFVFSEPVGEDAILMMGHSQIDDWEIRSLAGMKVINCGIRGISSFEYVKYILAKNLIPCTNKVYLIMHGTNDISMDKSDEEIIQSIMYNFKYIKLRRPDAVIYFLSCAHVNGRLDRNNKRISVLNRKFEEQIKPIVNYIDLSPLEDEFGDLKSEYSKDGLHFSSKGYDKLKEIIEKNISNNEKI